LKQKLKFDEWIAADDGFSGPHVLKKIKNVENDIQMKFNNCFKSTRVIIENLFAFCKI